MPRQKNEGPRDRIVQTASDLFRRYGFQAVGVDMIVAESDVAKMTLYRHFESKDDLIDECLRREDANVMGWIRHATEKIDDPRRKLHAFFEALEGRTSAAVFGCPFQLAAGEYPDPGHPAHVRARAHKRIVRAMLGAWVRSAGLKHAERTTSQLYLLMEGAWAAARMRLDPSPAPNLKDAVLLIVEGGLFAQAVAGPSSDDNTNND